jgi:VCBS repeat-containing protein
MIRAHRVTATAQDDASLVTGWNIAPNVGYSVTLLPGAVSCGVLLYDEGGVLVASGAALAGTDQPCVLLPQGGYALGMVDADQGWHMMLTTIGTESQRTIRISPAVDLPDEIHPIYGDDDLALVRATAGIDASSHYIDDVTVSCPLGLGAGLGDIASVPVDGAPVVGQVESITWTGTPNGVSEQVVIRRHVAIAPEAFVEPVLPTVADDTGTATHLVGTSGNVLTNDDSGLSVMAVNGLTGNVGIAVDGSNGGSFVLDSDGSWTFDPDGDFDLLSGSETANTSVTYHASDGAAEAMATLTVTVNHANTAPVAVDDTGETTADATTSGNVLTNDTDADLDSLIVSQVDGSAANVGVAVAGSNGGLFTIGADGAWAFDPNSEFAFLVGEETATTSVMYHVSNGVNQDEGSLAVIVTASAGGTPSYEPATVLVLPKNIAELSTSNYTLALTNLAEGDVLVLVTGWNGGSGASPGPISGQGWTQLVHHEAVASYPLRIDISYKVVGATPDPNVVVTGKPADANAGIVVAHGFRNIDIINGPLDVAVSSADGSGTQANNPSVTTISDAIYHLLIGSWSHADTSISAPLGYSLLSTNSYGAWATGIGVGCAAKVLAAAGSEDPGEWRNVTSDTRCSWCAINIPLKIKSVIDGPPYRFFKFTMTEKTSSMWFGISELLLYDSDDVAHPTLNMTSDVSPYPLRAAASARYNDSYAAYKAFDGVAGISNRWQAPYGASVPQWISIDLGAGNEISPVRLEIAQNAVAITGFTLEGSNSGTFSGEQDLLYSASGLTTGWSTDVLRSFNL